MHDGAIGVFDSGLGGLTVVQALVDLLPDEDLVYVGDTARYPYGPRPAEELRRFSSELAGWLVARGVKMVVVACNSATAAALGHLRTTLDVPVVGVVEPGVRAARSASASGRVAVVGTEQTVRSRVYEQTAERLRAGLEVRTRACPRFVDLVERGETRGARARAVVAEDLAGLVDDVDALVLGCTHFPLLARTIGEVVGQRVVLVSSADETAFEVRDLLARTGLQRHGARVQASDVHAGGPVAEPVGGPAGGPGGGTGSRTFLTSGDPARFAELGERFLGWPLGDVGRWQPPS